MLSQKIQLMRNKHQDVFNILENEIACIAEDHEIMICGDFNGRTGRLPDFSAYCMSGNDENLPCELPDDNLTSDHEIRCMFEQGMLTRFSEDSHVNNHGKKLLDLCKTTRLLIINGRLGSDKGIGKYTQSDTTGCSVVDYAICSPNMFGKIRNFFIHDKFPESDHLPVCISIQLDKKENSIVSNNSYGWYPNYKYSWSKHSLEIIKRNLSDCMSGSYLNEVYDSLAELTNTNAVAENLNDYVMQACNRACELKPARAPGMKKPLQWYDEECNPKRGQAIKAGERVENYLDRQNLFEKCQQYRSCKQRKRRNFQC